MINIRNLVLVTLAASFSVLPGQTIVRSPEARHKAAAYKERLAKRILRANAGRTVEQQKFDALYYDLRLDIDPVNEVLTGDVSVRARALDPDLEWFSLDFSSTMQVDSVQAGGRPVFYLHRHDRIALALNPSPAAGEEFTVRVFYHGRPEQSGFGAFTFDRRRDEPMIWTLSEPFGARNWWPCVDSPDDKADSIDIRVTVPGNLIVASNGILKKVERNGQRRTYWWHESYPIASYLVSLAIHPYDVYSDWYRYSENDSMEIQFYIFPGRRQAVEANYGKTARMIEVLSDLFGPYPFLREKYGHAEFLWGGGMEHQTLTSLGGWSEDLIVHELAHQWWGDMITCESFHHIWLNEGFATYSEALWWEHAYDEKLLHQAMENEIYLGPGTVYVEDPETENIFDYSLTYAKASWVLHMLRHVVGDETFFAILRSYYERFKYSTANTEQFRDLCEEISGIELDAFFHQWIYQSGFPMFEYGFDYEPLASGAYRLHGILRQVQPGDAVFKMPVDLTVKYSFSDTTIVLPVESRFETFELVTDERPVRIWIDRDNWILKTVKRIPLTSAVDSGYLPEKFVLEQNYPNPFNPVTRARFSLPEAAAVTARIVNPLGQTVRSLEDRFLSAGTHGLQWDGRNDAGEPVSAGLYLLIVNAGAQSRTIKMVKLP